MQSYGAGVLTSLFACVFDVYIGLTSFLALVYQYSEKWDILHVVRMY